MLRRILYVVGPKHRQGCCPHPRPAAEPVHACSLQNSGVLLRFSNIRETMVKIMVTPAGRQHSALGGGSGAEGRLDAIVKAGEVSSAFGGSELPVGPSTCVFGVPLPWEPWSGVTPLSR